MAPAAVALLVVLIPAIFTATASAAVVEHTFNVILGAVSYMIRGVLQVSIIPLLAGRRSNLCVRGLQWLACA